MSLLTKAATTLLDAAGESALAGDLLEERRSGRSSFWYGRQVASALWHVVVRGARGHAFHAFCAMAIGWIVIQVIDGQLPFSAHPEVNAWVARVHLAWAFAAMRYFVAGWVVSLVFASSRQRFAMVGAATLFFLFRAVIGSALMVWGLSRVPAAALQVSKGTLVADVVFAIALPVVTLAGGLVGPIRRVESLDR
ncbi:MAG TPA: hypothetical protein VG871_12430 [Vicinamibacterales bacterium]|nr:hypothetical protein [Vicinamibacterales bacterium]